MAFTTSTDPKPLTVFALEMVLLFCLPPLVLGFGLAAVAGGDVLAPAAAVGLIVGAGAAKLRNEIRGARVGE